VEKIDWKQIYYNIELYGVQFRMELTLQETKRLLQISYWIISYYEKAWFTSLSWEVYAESETFDWKPRLKSQWLLSEIDHYHDPLYNQQEWLFKRPKQVWRALDREKYLYDEIAVFMNTILTKKLKLITKN
jgi:hypothetical protein